MELEDWIKQNWLDVEIVEPNMLFVVKDVGVFLVIKPKEGLIFDDGFDIILDDLESSLAESVNFFTFCFGGKWYYFSVEEEPSLNPLKYLGTAKV